MNGIIALWLAALSGFAAQPAEQAARAAETEANVVTLGAAALGRMTVPVQIGDHGPYDFVIDTGAERSVLSRELASTLALNPGRPVRIFGFAGVASVGTVVVPALSVSTLGAATLEAPALAWRNLGATGMLGIDALRGHRVSIDFVRNRMTLVPARRRGRGQIAVRARDHAGQLIVTSASYNGQRISVVIDTGSAVSVGNLAMRRLALRPPRLLGPISITSVTGQSFDTDYVVTDGLKIGGVGFDRMPLAFADAPPFERFGLADTPALILGMSALKLFRRVDIDFANREILFTLPPPPLRFGACKTMLNCRTFGS